MVTYSELSTKFSGTNVHAFWTEKGVYAYNGLSFDYDTRNFSEWAYTAQPDGSFKEATPTEKTAFRNKAALEDKQLARMVGK